MSAWIVSKKHIDALVTFAVENDLIVTHNNEEYRIADNPDRVGQELWAENYRSVNYRYAKEIPVPLYIFQREEFDGIIICKNLSCYDYQTCECDDYNETFAKAFVIELNKTLEKLGYTWKKLEGLIEFENASWGID